MGEPGRFWIPELVLLARELTWSVGRIGCKRLATVLIGAGSGNIPVVDAVAAWLCGIAQALEGAERRLQSLSFVEHSAAQALEIDQALCRLAKDPIGALCVKYEPLAGEAVTRLRTRARNEAIAAAKRAATAPQVQSDKAPTRITLGLEGRTYRFGAITDSAAIPERTVELDPRLVQDANDEMAAEPDIDLQRQRGQFMQSLLVPDDLRSALASDAPLVLLLDNATARIHWEMLAQPAANTAPLRDAFLGTARSLTRQLRTGFAAVPEPPPPPRRVLRVLVIADPAEDAHLPGAEEEGAAVADLFERVNTAYAGVQRVEVSRLFGPVDATRTNVLRELTTRSYDVLHFAGHCAYVDGQPASSGWIFSHNQVLSAYELTRVDRVPKFVFSNACESGITPDRASARSAALAPAFAEAFFARGVANFVCTAWPIDDLAATTFALQLYGGLLGLDPKTGQVAGSPVPIHAAIRNARWEILETLNGVATWGAYQHYGNPYFRLLDPRATSTAPLAEPPADKPKRPRRRRR